MWWVNQEKACKSIFKYGILCTTILAICYAWNYFQVEDLNFLKNETVFEASVYLTPLEEFIFFSKYLTYNQAGT